MIPPDIQAILPKIPGSETVPWLIVALCVLSAAVIAWGLTEAVKSTALRRVALKNADVHTLWWTPMLTVVAIIIGFGVGSFIGGVGWEWKYGAICGASGGALSSFIVNIVKRFLKGKADKMIDS